MLYYGRDYPLGNAYFVDRLRKSFARHRSVQEPAEIEKLVARGHFVIKEIEALYKLKKYRYLKRSYYDTDAAELDQRLLDRIEQQHQDIASKLAANK